MSSSKPPTSTSYPRLHRVFSKQTSSPNTSLSPDTTVSLLNQKNLAGYNSLHRVDTASSFARNRIVDDNSLFANSNASDGRGIAKQLSKGTTSLGSDDGEEVDSYVSHKEPIEIRVRCIFSRVGEIDTLNERYTAEIFFEASWYDESHKIGHKYDPQLGHFNPQLVVLNHIGDSLRHEVCASPPLALSLYYWSL